VPVSHSLLTRPHDGDVVPRLCLLRITEGHNTLERIDEGTHTEALSQRRASARVQTGSFLLSQIEH